MAESGAAGMVAGGGLGVRQAGAVSSSRRQRAPVSTFAISQEVLAWHRVHGWQSAVVHSVREDGKYVLNWQNGDETDRIKTRTNLRKGIKDQMKNSAKSSSAPLAMGTGLRDDGAVHMNTSLDGGVSSGEMAADGVKIGTGEVVISGGEVYAGSADAGVSNAAEAGVLAGGIKVDQQDALGASLAKREKKMSLDGEGEEDDSQAEIHNGSRPVPPPLSAGGWSKSEHRGLMSMWFQTKKWYHCEQCDYLNDRLYHSKMHYERIHVKNGKQQFHKRKHTNASDSPSANDGMSAVEDDGADDSEDRDGCRKSRLKAKSGAEKEGQAVVGDKGAKSPAKGLKAGAKNTKGFTQAGLDVLATLVTAEANAKGEGGVTPLSIKAWLDMQMSLASKSKLAAAEIEAKDEAGRDAKRARTKVSDATTPASPTADKGGALKKGGTPKTKGEGEGSSLGSEADGSAFDEYQKAYQTALAATSAFTCASTPAAAAAAMDEYSKAYNKAINATAAIDWSKLPAGVVNPLILASFAASTPPGPDVALTDGDAKGKGEAGKGKDADAAGGVRLDAAPTTMNSLEGGVAVLLDAMRRHSEEGGSAAAKKAKAAKGGKKPGSGEGGDEASALGDISSLDVATASALSALIPPWLLQQLSTSTSGLGAGGALAGGGVLGGEQFSDGSRLEAEGDGKEREDQKEDGKSRNGQGEKGKKKDREGVDHKKSEEEEDVGSEAGANASDKKGETGDSMPREGEALMACALAVHSTQTADDVAAAEAQIYTVAGSVVEGIPPPPAPPVPGAESEDPLQTSPAAPLVDAGASAAAAAAAGKSPQMVDAKVYQARPAHRWPAGLTTEGLVKEPRGKSRREVKNALANAQAQNLVKIVGDEGTLSRDPTLVEAGVLLPVPGGRSDEAILRIDFMFDLATLEGRKKRAQFFKLINGAVGQIGREHSLHNSVVNVIKNMCFMPGSWEPGSPTANWKDAQCWKFRQEMLQMHVTKMREEAQNRKRKRESHGNAETRPDASVAHGAEAQQREDGGGQAGLAADFKENVRVAVSGMGGAAGSLGFKSDASAEGAKGKLVGVDALALSSLAAGKVGEGVPAAGVAGTTVLGGIGVLLEVVNACARAQGGLHACSHALSRSPSSQSLAISLSTCI